MDDDQRAESLSGPGSWALRWYGAVFDEAVGEVWAQMSDDFRLAMVQGVLMGNPEAVKSVTQATRESRDEVAHSVAASHDRALTEQVQRIVVRQIKRACEEADPADLSPGTNPRPLGVDLELVRLIYVEDAHGRDADDPGIRTWEPGDQARAVSVVVDSSTGQWRAAGIGHYILRPGWPPEQVQVADETV